MKYTITPKEKPPLGLMGGSVHDYERGKDPFARECMPPEFQDRFPDKPAATGWLAIDWCGNVIGFAQDGNVIELKPLTNHEPTSQGNLRCADQRGTDQLS